MKILRFAASCLLAAILLCSACVPSVIASADDSAKVTSGEDKWLHLSTNTKGPRYFVDSSGQPVQLFGMARCQFHAQMEDALFTGSPDRDALIRHYTDAGCNLIRLAVSFTTETHPADRVEECGGYNEEGINRFIDEYVDPDVQAIINAGAYVMIDQHNYIPGAYLDSIEHMKEYAYSRFGKVMVEIAKRYADEPMVAVLELWNEPFPADSAAVPLDSPKWNIFVRDFFIDTVEEVRKYDSRHVLMVSDWNAGWGCQTLTTWEDFMEDLDPDCRNTCFSIHLAREHFSDEMRKRYEDSLKDIASQNVCLVFGEIETEEELMSTESMANLLGFMAETKDRFHFSGCLWRVHDDVTSYRTLWEPFVAGYNTVFDDIAAGEGWYINRYGALYITGEIDGAPWSGYAKEIKSAKATDTADVKSAEGIFAGCDSLDTVTLSPEFLQKVKAELFALSPAWENVSSGEIYKAESDFDSVIGEVTLRKCELPVIAGDTNGDGTVNAKDVSVLMKYFAGYGIECDMQAADYNGDGNANAKDVSAILKYLADWK